MTSPKLLIPLRVPELGPSFGKLVTGTRHVAGGLDMDAYRVQLVTKLMDAAGEARRLASNEERGAALAALCSQVWLDAWDEMVAAVTDKLVQRINGRLEAEAFAVRMPRRLWRHLLPDGPETRALAGRLGAAGARLVPALDALEVNAGRVLDATVRERGALEEWQQALSVAARRLEEAWILLEEEVERELREWEELAERVSRWRKPMWPVVVVGIPALALATWLGLVLGGYLAPPEWLEWIWQALS